MGRVFTWQEMSLHKVPSKKDFEKVCDLIQDRINNCQWIIGGLFCGSVLRGDSDFRSDIDCLVLYRTDHRLEAIDFLDHLVEVAKRKYNVPVEFMPVNSRLASKGRHTIGRGFLEHLKLAAEHEGIIKEDPLQWMSFEGKTLIQDVAQFIDLKVRELDKRSTELSIMNQKDLSQFLQKVLETPVNLARKMNQWQGIWTPDDSKKATIALYTVIVDKEKSGLLKYLCKKDASYSAEVRRQMRMEKPDKRSYEQALEELKILTSETFKFVEANTLWFERGL